MGKHESSHRKFILSKQAWYYGAADKDIHEANGVVNEIMFGLYHPEGGTTGEMAFRWYDIGNSSVPKLEVFAGSWDALSTFQDVIEGMRKLDHKDVTEAMIVDLLISCGFEDATKRQR